ncbi:MAG: Dihydropteroate synthase [Deltaproteobacteria bacterium ADurb.Bin510]|nr:MAG: Dihydropteroate synthase [Deltaproteobacteria bacterium ADurb.Bin510]
MVDPGIGFGKDLAGNLRLIKHIAQFKSLGVPVLLGHSRKSFLGQLLNAEVHAREQGTDAVTAWACLEGADFVRVHDVRRACEIRTTVQAIGNAP